MGRGRFGLLAVIALYLAAVAAVNPLRNCPVGDDWAYADTAWHFLHKGEYRLHEWLSANIPFQTAWGGLFCVAFGESFAALRLSTVALLVIGLIAFRGLAIEHGLDRRAANLLTLCVACSSLLFRMSLSFMTDVPFFCTMTVALLCYTRAARRMTLAAWGLAALAGAAAVLTRQFGAAIIPAVGIVWLLDPQRFRKLADYLVGLSLPVLAAGWQFQQGWFHSNWAAQFQFVHQRLYLFGGGFLRNLPWRPTVMMEYCALWLPALVLVAAIGLAREIRVPPVGDRSVRPFEWRPLAEFLAWCAFFAGAVVYGWKVVGYLYDAPHISGHHALMPFLGWNYELLHVLGEPVRWGITCFVVAGAALFARRLVARYTSGRLERAELLLDFTALSLLALNLLFGQLWDQYLLVYLSYAAIAIGKPLQGVLIDWRRAVVGSCVALLIGAAIWTREDLAKDEAIWTLAAGLKAEGVPPERISADWQWLFYWKFDDLVRAGKATGRTSYSDLYDHWLSENRAAADYWIVHDPHAPPGETWQPVAQASYFSVYARRRETFYAIKREKAPGNGGRRAGEKAGGARPY